MVTREQMVQRFHEVMGQPANTHMNYSTLELVELRGRLIREECDELLDELKTIQFSDMDDIDEYHKYKSNILKEMADLQYVLSGLAVTFGLDLEEAFKRVHLSNMSKLGDDGKPIYRDDGKVTKGPNYKPPYLGDLV